MQLEDVRGRFPADKRKLYEIDRILVVDDEGRFGINLRAGYSETNINMGAGSPRLSRKVPVAEALVAMDEHLSDVPIAWADLWGALMKNAGLEAIVGCTWMGGVVDLTLGANQLTKKGIDALVKRLGDKLERLVIGYNKLGGALSKAKFSALEALEIQHCGLKGADLAKLGNAPMPKLRRLALDGVGVHLTPERIIRANKMADKLPDATYSADELKAFFDTPLAKQLTWLSFGQHSFGSEHGAAFGAHLDGLEELYLHNTDLGAEGLTLLAEGAGLAALRKLEVNNAIAHNYIDGKLQPPSEETAAALKALANSHLAGTLRALVLDTNAIGTIGVRALTSGKINALDTLSLSRCQLGDEAVAVLANSNLRVERLVLLSNDIHETGVKAIVESELASSVSNLALHYCPIGDTGLAAIATAAPSALKRLSASGSGVTDDGVRALSDSELVGQLEFLNLSANRISDAGAELLAGWSKPPNKLLLFKNGFTARGIQLLEDKLAGVELHLGEQDPTKLPPRLDKAPRARFVEAQGVSEPKPFVIDSAIRKGFSHPNWLMGCTNQTRWAYAFEKSEKGYIAGAIDMQTGDRVVADPAIDNPLPQAMFSRDGRYMAVKAFRDGAYVVDLQNGAKTTRLGDVLTHQKGGVGFCGDRIVVMDCNTDGDWEGRIDVYGPTPDGGWEREHQLGGFFQARDEVVELAGGRIIGIRSDYGAFFIAIRGKALRFLGHLPVRFPRLYDADGQAIVRINRFDYRLANADEVLEEAFAAGDSPTTIDLPESVWP